MNPNKFLFPGILVICGTVIGLVCLVSTPRVTLASSGSSAPVQEAVSVSPAAVLSRVYPESVLQWENLIAASAEHYQLDPNFIAAVILQESGGNADAYSASGAVGLMQVMPSDGIAASFICNDLPCFRSRPSMQELFDPTFNIDYGSRMLAGLIEKYGSQQEALYHYGPIDVGYRYADTVLSIYTSYK